MTGNQTIMERVSRALMIANIKTGLFEFDKSHVGQFCQKLRDLCLEMDVNWLMTSVPDKNVFEKLLLLGCQPS